MPVERGSSMNYVYLAKTGVRVSELCLGTMTFGKEADEPTSIALMNRALEIGINFFDTANVYNKGLTEEIVGRWLNGRREQIVLASKVHTPTGDGLNERGSSRRNIVLEVERSLKRLHTDWLDVLYLHHWDDHTAIEETLSAVTTLREHGKVLYCGFSNSAAWQIMKAVATAEAKNLIPITCVQPMYSLLKRQVEVEILPMCQSEGLAVCPYNPLAAGMLTGKYLRGESGRLHESEMYERRYNDPRYPDVTQRFVEYATQRGYSPAALALAWVMSHPAITSTIIGARNLTQMNDTLGALDIRLTPEHRDVISALSIEPPSATDREK